MLGRSAEDRTQLLLQAAHDAGIVFVAMADVVVDQRRFDSSGSDDGPRIEKRVAWQVLLSQQALDESQRVWAAGARSRPTSGTEQLVPVDPQEPLGMESHVRRIHVLPNGARDIVGDHQSATRCLCHPFRQRRLPLLGQLIQTVDQAGRHHEETRADRIVIGQALTDGGHPFVPTRHLSQLDFRGVVEVEHTREIRIHGQNR